MEIYLKLEIFLNRKEKMNNILDGKALAKEIKDELASEIEKIKLKYNKKPGLAIILVGEDAASKIYVNSKIKGSKALGIESFSYLYNENTSEEEILKKIDELNMDENINGILVQLPLPKHIDEKKIIDRIALSKDVDGFKPENLGKLFLNDSSALISCTPAGIMKIFDKYNIDLSGKDLVIIGRSNIVGKPLAGLCINRSATVTVCHSRTKDLKEKTKNADIIIVAVGKSKFLTPDMVKEDAIIIDVGINRIDGKLTGDVDFENLVKKAKYITPVPGGVGPMTVAMLFYNTVKAFKIKNNI